MNTQTASATQSQHVVPRVADAGSRFSRNHSGLLASLGFVVLLCVPSTTWAQVAPPLGAASSFAVLSATPDVTNAGPTVVTGDLGVYPAGSVIGFPPGTVTGTIYAADLTAQNAQAANLTAYGFLAAETCTTHFTGVTDLAGMTLVPGVYCFDSSALNTGLLQLDAQGDPTAVWVFQTVSTLTTATGSHVVVINGGPTQACNVFWQVGTSATLFTSSTLVGNILAHDSIALQNAASLSGRAWAYIGEVTLDSNTVGGCSPNGAPNSITIVKNTVGGNDTFPFAATGVGVSGFSIVTTGNPGSGSHSFTGLFAGTYTFQETPIPASWSLTGLACVDPTNNSTVTLTTGTASVNLAEGEAVTCTYTDNLLPTPVANAPTLSEWAMILLATLLAIVGFAAMRRTAK